MVTVYMERTVDVNTYDQILSGMTKSKHEAKTRGMLVSVCNNAVATLIRISHYILTSPNQKGKKSSGSGVTLHGH